MATAHIPAYGAHFAARSVAQNYIHRPPYAPEVFEILAELLPVTARAVLDAGCGPGKLALGLLPHAARIDAVDPSAEMIALGRALPGGDDPQIRWIEAKIEDAPLAPPYGLIVAGASFHWMDTEAALSLFARSLAPGGVFALVSGDGPIDMPWRAAENEIFSDFILRLQGKLPNFAATDRSRLDTPLLDHPRFAKQGAKVTAPYRVQQSVDDYLACQHSRATWSVDFMGAAMAAEFDRRLGDLLAPYATGGMLAYDVQTRLEWGRPTPPLA